MLRSLLGMVCCVGRWLGQGENGIIFDLNMSGEMHMRRRNEVFGCIPHGRGALTGLFIHGVPMEGHKLKLD